MPEAPAPPPDRTALIVPFRPALALQKPEPLQALICKAGKLHAGTIDEGTPNAFAIAIPD